jgi:hypothetical protein
MKKKTETPVDLKPIDLKDITIKIIGTTPLITHAWDDKVKKMMLAAQMGEPKVKKHEIKNPVRDFVESMYWLEGKPDEYTEEAIAKAIADGARFGFPANGLKASVVSAGYRAGVAKDKVSQYGAFRINCEFIEIKGIPHPREDMVRVGNGAADIRFRGQFDEWSATIDITYNAGVISAEQLVNLFQLGGFAVGIGEWRPEKSGQFGMYRVAQKSDL